MEFENALLFDSEFFYNFFLNIRNILNNVIKRIKRKTKLILLIFLLFLRSLITIKNRNRVSTLIWKIITTDKKEETATTILGL